MEAFSGCARNPSQFGVTDKNQAELMKGIFLNQGFYNLFSPLVRFMERSFFRPMSASRTTRRCFLLSVDFWSRLCSSDFQAIECARRDDPGSPSSNGRILLTIATYS